MSSGQSANPTFVDIDADGDFDAFIGYANGVTEFFRNVGSATAPRFAVETGGLGISDVGSQASPTFADIDGDGDRDAFVGSGFGDIKFFRNTGSDSVPAFEREAGNFGLAAVDRYAKPALVDIDGDGDLDAFVGARYGTTRFFRNTGDDSAARFVAESSNLGIGATRPNTAPALGDIDGDDDFDLIEGNNEGLTRVFRNVGGASDPAFKAESSSFGLPIFQGTIGPFARPALVDIDEDGDLDIFIGRSGSIDFFENVVNAFGVNAPPLISLVDTIQDDNFATVSGAFSSRGAGGGVLSYGIVGGVSSGGTVSLGVTSGVLTVTKATGAYTFVPNNAALDALGTNLSQSFKITVADGIRIGDQGTLTVTVVQSGITETAGNDTLTGTMAHDRISSLEGEDLVNGGAGNDTLSGGPGNDILDGGTGNDSLVGGSGNDLYRVDSPSDVINESSTLATEIDSVSSSVTWALGINLEKLTLTGSSAINGTGNTLANTITGNTGNNSISGSNGNDTLVGGGGNDTLNGGSGNDSLNGGTGNDSYTVDSSTDVVSETTTTTTEIDSVTSSVAWTLGGNLEKLTLTGTSAINGTGNTLANTITGNTGNNSLTGSSGHDTLVGGGGNDTLNGGTGNDGYIVDSSTDVISETTTTTTEIDRVSSSVAWTLGSNLERLTLTGTTAINGTGNTLANEIIGSTGNNLLDGGSGNDTLSGGAGLDIYRFSSALNGSSNGDTVSDFAVVDDAIQLENSIFLKLTMTGALSSSFFRASTSGTAADSNDYINYETDTGKLFYDADGNGAGVAVLFATLTGAPAISSLDIFVT